MYWRKKWAVHVNWWVSGMKFPGPNRVRFVDDTNSIPLLYPLCLSWNPKGWHEGISFIGKTLKDWILPQVLRLQGCKHWWDYLPISSNFSPISLSLEWMEPSLCSNFAGKAWSQVKVTACVKCPQVYLSDISQRENILAELTQTCRFLNPAHLVSASDGCVLHAELLGLPLPQITLSSEHRYSALQSGFHFFPFSSARSRAFLTRYQHPHLWECRISFQWPGLGGETAQFLHAQTAGQLWMELIADMHWAVFFFSCHFLCSCERQGFKALKTAQTFSVGVM